MDEESLSSVSLFDYSSENHLRSMDAISKLCPETDIDDLDQNQLLTLSSSIIFLREWRDYKYEPRILRFPTDEAQITEIKLPQFSSATVPKNVELDDDAPSLESSNDFVMYVGGSVLALDWCPRVHEKPDNHIRCEFLAVAAHPPESCYYEIGAPLTGRGMVQIWCMLNASNNENVEATVLKKGRGRAKQKTVDESFDTEKPKRPRGRPRKMALVESEAKKPKGRTRNRPIDEQKPVDESLDTEKPKRPRRTPRKLALVESQAKKPIDEPVNNFNDDNQFAVPLTVEFPEDQFVPIGIDQPSKNIEKTSAPKNKDEVGRIEGMASLDSSVDKLPIRRKNLKEMEGIAKDISTTSNESLDHRSMQDSAGTNVLREGDSLDISLTSSIPKDIALPRVVLCLAHNGKVAWDVKWRPSNINDPKCKHRMGYLAVLLGNGSLEVWEVPLPQAMKAAYSLSSKEGTDPRFVKLEPVFRCSMLKCGDTKSIPLTVEWSTSAKPDFLLAGCHDGTVALWKFSTDKTLEDTRPICRFSADTVPIRAVAWAPAESDPESANIIITSGRERLKFWDIRNPYRPLWDVQPSSRFILSLDWVSDPRCVAISFDDGTMRMLSLLKAASDVPATGKPFTAIHRLGMGCYNCLSFSIWSVHVSRLTGLAAYCCEDGSVHHFLLTMRAVDKDVRYRTAHFQCGSLSVEDSAIRVGGPLPNNPKWMKKPVNDENSKSILRSLLTDSIQPGSANDDKPKIPLLALCNGEDRSAESESEEMLSEAYAGNRAPKSSNSKRKVEEKESVSAIVEVKENSTGKIRNQFDTFPSKLVAMHKVRWNMNKGSERWLCSGGAAGIVRCQEIYVTERSRKTRISK